MPEEPVFRIPLALLVWAATLLLPTAVLAAVLSALLERSGPIRLRHWAEEAGGRLRALYDDQIRFGLFRYLLSLVARLAPLLFYVALAELLDRLRRMHPSALALATVLLLVASVEVLNRVLVGRDPERALRALTYAYRGVLILLAPILTLLAPLVPVRPERDGEEGESASDEEIEAFIDVGTREGILEPEQGEMLWSIVDFADTLVRSVMTPRIDMICAPVTTAIEDLAERFVESGHSRLPIFQDSIDHIIGILHIRDVLRALRSPEPLAITDLLKPPLFIPETKPLGELLKELQARFQQVAIVVDEYGGTAGLVTVEDLLEEIVGEIMDEHEALVAELEPVSEGVWKIDGRAHIELLEELFEVELDDPEFETVAGLIFSVLGRVPQVGESVESYGLRFTVEGVADRRIQTVRVERIPAGEPQTKEADS
jgi:CBS domain containing-hemolysin-like protein